MPDVAAAVRHCRRRPALRQGFFGGRFNFPSGRVCDNALLRGWSKFGKLVGAGGKALPRAGGPAFATAGRRFRGGALGGPQTRQATPWCGRGGIVARLRRGERLGNNAFPTAPGHGQVLLRAAGRESKTWPWAADSVTGPPRPCQGVVRLLGPLSWHQGLVDCGGPVREVLNVPGFGSVYVVGLPPPPALADSRVGEVRSTRGGSPSAVRSRLSPGDAVGVAR